MSSAIWKSRTLVEQTNAEQPLGFKVWLWNLVKQLAGARAARSSASEEMPVQPRPLRDTTLGPKAHVYNTLLVEVDKMGGG